MEVCSHKLHASTFHQFSRIMWRNHLSFRSSPFVFQQPYCSLLPLNMTLPICWSFYRTYMGLRWKGWELGFACLNLNYTAVLNLDISGISVELKWDIYVLQNSFLTPLWMGDRIGHSYKWWITEIQVAFFLNFIFNVKETFLFLEGLL